MNQSPHIFTAAQIGAVAGITAQAVRQRLSADGIAPVATVMVNHNQSRAWTLEQLPEEYRRLLVSAPVQIPLNEIHKDDVQQATEHREIFRHWLIHQHDPGLSSTDIDTALVANFKTRGKIVSVGFVRKLFARFMDRAGVQPDWDDLMVYLPARPRPKEFLPATQRAATSCQALECLQYHLTCNFSSLVNLSREQREGIWKLALNAQAALVSAGAAHRESVRQVVSCLFAHAPFLAASAESLRKTFKYRLTNGVKDKRCSNGKRIEYNQADLELIRHFASEDHDGCIDEAWRAHYTKLSEQTRSQHPFSWSCPKTFRKAINPTLVTSLAISKRSQKELREEVGFLTLDHSGMASMDEMMVDDVTLDFQIYFEWASGQTTLLRPQMIICIDRASRKILSAALSNEKGPRACFQNCFLSQSRMAAS